MLCGDLNGKEIQKRMDICTQAVDSLCCTSEVNTTLQRNYFNKIFKRKSTWGLEAEPGRKSYKRSTATGSGLGTPTTEVFAKDAFRSWTIAAHADGGESEVFVIFTVYIMQTSVCMLILCGLQRIISCTHLLHLSVLDRNTVIFFPPP